MRGEVQGAFKLYRKRPLAWSREMRRQVKDIRKSEGRVNWSAPGNGKAWATNLKKELGLSRGTVTEAQWEWNPFGDGSESDMRWNWRNVLPFLSLKKNDHPKLHIVVR